MRRGIQRWRENRVDIHWNACLEFALKCVQRRPKSFKYVICMLRSMNKAQTNRTHVPPPPPYASRNSVMHPMAMQHGPRPPRVATALNITFSPPPASPPSPSSGQAYTLHKFFAGEPPSKNIGENKRFNHPVQYGSQNAAVNPRQASVVAPADLKMGKYLFCYFLRFYFHSFSYKYKLNN